MSSRKHPLPLNPKKKRAAKADKTVPNPPTDWEVLLTLIKEYADAQEADSWKGGGDPNDHREIELRLELAVERLNNHIRKMQENYT